MFLIFASFANATIVAASLDPAGLAQLSDGYVQGVVLDAAPRWSDGAIWTVARVEDARGWVSEVWLRGGCIQSVCMTVAGAPVVDEGDEVYVFLRGREPTSLSQGLFHLHGDEAVRDTATLAVAQGPKPVARYPLAELEWAAARLPRR